MRVRDYVERISYGGKLPPSYDVLSGLQEAHLRTVPFENLDIHAGRRIVLEERSLFRKIVTNRRGGFCYELNGLFNWLLREIGFHATIAMGRVYDSARGTYGPDFDHMLNLVALDGRNWLVDVGFGDFSMHPLEIVLDSPREDVNGRFVIERDDGEYLRVSRFSSSEDRYVPAYLFSRKARQLGDFSRMCLYHQTSPDSHFTQHRICTQATARGRITLTDNRLIRTEGGERSEIPLSGEQEFADMLARHFGIRMERPADRVR